MRRFLYYLLLFYLATGGIVKESLEQISSLTEQYNCPGSEHHVATFAAIIKAHYRIYNNSHTGKRHAALPFHCQKVQPSSGMALRVFHQVWQANELLYEPVKTIFIYDFQLPGGYTNIASPPPKSC